MFSITKIQAILSIFKAYGPYFWAKSAYRSLFTFFIKNFINKFSINFESSIFCFSFGKFFSIPNNQYKNDRTELSLSP
jgi:hypothetical protein